jgi:hypothetical protein
MLTDIRPFFLDLIDDILGRPWRNGEISYQLFQKEPTALILVHAGMYRIEVILWLAVGESLVSR